MLKWHEVWEKSQKRKVHWAFHNPQYKVLQVTTDQNDNQKVPVEQTSIWVPQKLKNDNQNLLSITENNHPNIRNLIYWQTLPFSCDSQAFYAVIHASLYQ